ncbi:MAG: glycosyltransferase family 4 protein, partial [Armatimonadota bacterium]
IQIANGFSPEARVFASLLNQDSHAVFDGAPLQYHVIHHSWPEDRVGIEQFRRAVSPDVELHPVDFGWRPMTARRSLPTKVKMRLHFLTQLPRVLYQARRLRPDVIYSCQQYWDCQAATYLARRLKRPQIIHLHYTVGPWLHKPVLQRLLDCDRVLAISEFIRGEALRHGVPVERVITVRNSIAVPEMSTQIRVDDIRRELGICNESPLIGMIARLDPQKGQDHAIRAFAEVRASYPNASLLLVGSETSWHVGYEDSLRRLSTDLGVSEGVRFLGHRRDVLQILRRLDVFLHPAEDEPFGLAVAEASAAGLPVVAYADGAMPEVIEHGITGFLSPRQDSTQGLAKNVCALLAEPPKAIRMGEAGRHRMQRHFTEETAARHFHHVLRDLLRLPVAADCMR